MINSKKLKKLKLQLQSKNGNALSQITVRVKDGLYKSNTNDVYIDIEDFEKIESSGSNKIHDFSEYSLSDIVGFINRPKEPLVIREDK